MISKPIYIDVDDYLYERITSVQYDNGTRFLDVHLLSNGQAIDLTGTRVIISGEKPDGEEIFNSTVMKDTLNGNVMVELTEQMNAVPGDVKCQLELYGEAGQLLTTKTFNIEVTKRAGSKSVASSSEFGALKKALEEVQDIDNRFAQTNAQLLQKANSNEVRKKTESILLEDLHTEVKIAMTGGSVAVVAENAVGKENIKSNAVTYSKVDHSIMKNPLTNLISTDLYKGAGKNGGTIEEQADGSFILTSTSTYGTFNRIIDVEEHRVYLCISKVKLIEGSDVKARHICYNYSSTNENLGSTNGTNTPLTGEYISLVDVLKMKPTGVKGHFGVLVDKECVSQIKDQIILDITGISEDILSKIDFSSYGGGYWEHSLENIVLSSEVSKYSLESEHSKTSDSATSSDISNKSKISDYALDGNFVKPAKLHTNLMGGFHKITEDNNHKVWGNGAKVNIITETQELHVSPTESWGELLLWTPIKTGETDTPILYNRQYKFVVKIRAVETVPVKCTCFMYNQSGAQLGSLGGTLGDATDEYQYLMWDFTVNKEDTYKIAIGITNRKSEPFAPFVVKDVMLIDITDEPLTNQEVETLGGYWDKNPQIVEIANKAFIAEKAMSLDESVVIPSASKWNGKTALVIGDSITAAQKWQKKLKEDLQMNVKTHAKGGVGTIAMVDGDKGLGGDYDNETSASGTLYPLNTNDVTGVDLIVVLPAYNDRGKDEGAIGDVYPNKSTIIGIVQYIINRIYEELAKANNLNCKVLFATPHCAGKYNYIDADGYDEYPNGSGCTMETMSDTIKMVCNYNNIPVCDLWHNSGINKFTWTIYGAQPNAVNEQYAKYELNERGEVIGETPIRYVKGQSYYQIRDGQVILEEYTGSAPYPFNGDQLHCSNLGYARIGECIVGSIIQNYGY